MKGFKTYFFSGAAVLFVAGLFAFALLSGPAEQATAKDDALQQANPVSITKNDHWSDKLRQGNIDTDAPNTAKQREEEQKVTNPTIDPKDLIAIQYATRRARAEAAGRLDEFLESEEVAEKKRQRAYAKDTAHREYLQSRREHDKQMQEYEELKKEWKMQARAAREQGLEAPPEPVEPPRVERPEILRSDNRDKRENRTQ